MDVGKWIDRKEGWSGLKVGDRLVNNTSQEPFEVMWFFDCGTAYIKQRGLPCGYHSVHPEEFEDFGYTIFNGSQPGTGIVFSTAQQKTR